MFSVCHGYLSADEYFNLSSSDVTRVNSNVTTRGDDDVRQRAVDVHPAPDRNGYVEIGKNYTLILHFTEKFQGKLICSI